MQNKLTMNDIYAVTSHTRHVGPGSTFIAIKGERDDGVRHIMHALELGARRIVCARDVHLDEDTCAAMSDVHAELVRVDNTRAALAELSAQAYGYPAQKLNIIGITGTKGKSSCTYLLSHVLRSAGFRVACISTIANWIGDHRYKAELTTEQPDYLQAFLAECVAQQIDWVVMEVAAQALSLHRVDGIPFAAGIFTNFSQEHGEFYATMESYFAAKTQLLAQLKPGAPLVLNAGDARVARLAEQYAHTIMFGDGNRCQWHCPALIGAYNQQNLQAVYTLARELGVADDVIRAAYLNFPGVPGRLEGYRLPNGATVYIDYAHNPSSFEGVLSTLRGLTDDLMVVFGAGGNRESGKRPIMGEIAARYAHRIFLTSDNPRFEDAAQITHDIYAGITSEDRMRVTIELDRAAAITAACCLAKPNSIIALLGKGPDEYQEVRGVKHFFSEKEIIKAHGGVAVANSGL